MINVENVEMDNFLHAFNKLNYKSIYWNENNITTDKIFISKFKDAIKQKNNNCFASFVGKTGYINYMDNDVGFIPLFKVFFFKNSDGIIVAKRKYQRLSKQAKMILNGFATNKAKRDEED